MSRKVSLSLLSIFLAGGALTAQARPAPAYNEVVLCEHAFGGGEWRSFVLEPWMRHLIVPHLGDFNDKASSIWVGSGVHAVLFKDTHLQGPRGPLLKLHNGDSRNLISDKNDVVSSLMVHRNKAEYGADCLAGGSGYRLELTDRRGLGQQYQYAWYPLPESHYEGVARYPELYGHMRDNADEAAVHPLKKWGCDLGVEADLYRDPAFGGKRLRLPMDDATKTHIGLESHGLLDDVASVVVKVRDWKPAAAYEITVRTSQMKGAGTDAGVFMTLFGEKATVGRLRLDTFGKNFERGQEDIFTVELDRDIGHISKIRVEHDNSGPNPGWFLDEVRVTNRATGDEWRFVANVWFSVAVQPYALVQDVALTSGPPPLLKPKKTPGSGGKVLDGVDFPGRDLVKDKPIVYTQNASLERCIQDCVGNPDCGAFTYVKPDPQGRAECWLKRRLPDEAERKRASNPQCVSGVVRPPGS